MVDAVYAESEWQEDHVAYEEEGEGVGEVLTHPDVLASIMGQLGLRQANLTASVCTVRTVPSPGTGI